MEIFALAFGAIFVASIAERSRRRRLYAPDECVICKQTVVFDWKTYCWRHESTGLVKGWTVYAKSLPAYPHLAEPRRDMTELEMME